MNIVQIINKQTQSLLFTYNKNDSIEYNKVLSLRNKAKEGVMIDTIIEDMIKRESLIFECKWYGYNMWIYI